MLKRQHRKWLLIKTGSIYVCFSTCYGQELKSMPFRFEKTCFWKRKAMLPDVESIAFQFL